MLQPIKRVFVPKPASTPAESVVAKPATPAGHKPAPRFNELPSPDMEEKDSDSVWAEFDSVKPHPLPHK